MSPQFVSRLARLGASAQGALAGGLRGLEKEALRVYPDGSLALTAHPGALGSAMLHPYITTDFSEALLEFVTPALPSSVEVLEMLADIHGYTCNLLDGEILWATSMPCVLSGDEHVPLARYGNSNVGRMKTIYRRGLGYRYGRVMQTISGVHFNYSVPEDFWPMFAELEGRGEACDALRSETYMGLVRNFHRCGWLVLYLFGASPAVCRSFFRGRETTLEEFDSGTVYSPWSTSLRMSDLGYQNSSQARLDVSLNSVEEYIEGLTQAMRTPHPDYARIGVQVDGIYRQLSPNWLQIENEYYSLIRPKRVAHSGERPTQALRRGGVQYVEVRALDVSVFDPVGVNLDQLRFMEALLIYCLLSESPLIDAAERDALERNHRRVAREGRRPGFQLERAGGPVSLAVWAGEILDGVAAVAELLDVAGDGAYGRAVLLQREALREPARLPSARILAEMRDRDESFFQFAMRMSTVHHAAFRNRALRPEIHAHLAAESAASLAAQQALEAQPQVPFETYLEQYFADS
jgi:glutamate--cysteine ligase